VKIIGGRQALRKTKDLLGKSGKVEGADSLTPGERFVIGDHDVVPILRTVYACQIVEGQLMCGGAKQPVALLFISAGGTRAVNLDGEEIPSEPYLERFPQFR